KAATLAAEPLANAESAAPASISTPKATTAPVAADSPWIFTSLNGMGSWFSICRLIKIEAGQVTAKAEQQPKSRRSVLWLNATGGTMDTDPRPFRLALYVGEGLGQTAHNAFKIIITPL